METRNSEPPILRFLTQDENYPKHPAGRLKHIFRRPAGCFG